MKRILRLNLKAEYFHAIRDGSKPEEFRLASKWERRLDGKSVDSPIRSQFGVSLFWGRSQEIICNSWTGCYTFGRFNWFAL